MRDLLKDKRQLINVSARIDKSDQDLCFLVSALAHYMRQAERGQRENEQRQEALKGTRALPDYINAALDAGDGVYKP